MAAGLPIPTRSSPAAALAGTVTVPGDKSISHRALMFGALAIGETVISGLLEGEDVLRTAKAMQAFGADITRATDGSGQMIYRVHGVGIGGLREPADMLDLGNAGTGVRLLMGLAATHPINTFFTGDGSLRRRPMARVIEPLSRTGARFLSRSSGRLPVAVEGAHHPLPLDYTLPVASAQVKSAVLLAGLNTPGITRVVEPEPSRDHSENMLRHFGARLTIESDGKHGRVISLTGQPELRARPVVVPGDPSSAAFPLVAAAIVPGSRVTIQNVGLNPLRTGLFATLLDMGADMVVTNRREEGGEPVGDLVISHRGLKGVVVPPERAPSMIDEYPILAVAAALADGRTEFRGAKEMRVKESDRLAAMAKGLAAQGVQVEELEDGLIIHGNGQPPAGGGHVVTDMDHRIAMSFLVLGAAAARPIEVDDTAFIETSFPGFAKLMNNLGARIAPSGHKERT